MRCHDQLGREVTLVSPPKRIISLVPSQTELLVDLGLNDRLVGITKFCIYPDHTYRSKQRIGGTKTPDINLIHSLKPDLCIANKEENRKEDIDAIQPFCPVWVSDVNNREDALDMIRRLGILLDCTNHAEKLISEIEGAFASIKPIDPSISVLYFIWKEPTYIAGKGTFIDSMLKTIGLKNATNQVRYPEFTDVDSPPEVILLSSEPYPFSEKHIQEFQALFPNSKVMLVDGEMFSWFGSRMLKAPHYFNELLALLKG
jgi:ABC-type Fe3+-hydroxamate transport system substrate-binding protein